MTERFEQHTPHLRAVAYRMLGSATDADDAVQEAWLRIRDQDPASVENMRAWLTTIVGRVCLNMLRSRRSRREEFAPHVPDPVVSCPRIATGAPLSTNDATVARFDDSGDPEREALLADSVGLGLLVVLDALVAVLDPDVELRIDGGALRPQASLRLHGAAAVAGHAATYSSLYPFVSPAVVNGAAGAVVAPRGRLFSVMAFTVTDGRITQIDALVDPERRRPLDRRIPPDAGER